MWMTCTITSTSSGRTIYVSGTSMTPPCPSPSLPSWSLIWVRMDDSLARILKHSYASPPLFQKALFKFTRVF
ncbi:hypothetical protein E2C01_091916 [Portunus trituberculatus]|uniref:Uncharacterized protein n=1 Tax=Portunus trituberculatus TaxID=210409 RepID=A0A5B7JQP1_PORTR|nr:hypothetical protein [Portunus trituberculatus]